MKTTYLLLLLSLISLRGISQNEFTFKLYNSMDVEGNILFSPTSIKTAFAMAYEGTNGQTQKEFEEVFGFKENNSAFLKEIEHLKTLAEISNAIWIQNDFKVLKSYLKTIEANFGSAPSYTDFYNDPAGSAKKINDWIEKSTKGMIKKMLNPSDVAEFKLALVNAIYFKQNWKKTFDKEKTKKDKFTNADGSKSEVDLMHSTDYYKAFEGKDESIIELPYDDGKTSMVILLPHNMKKYKITDKNYTELTSKMYNQKVILDLPKFTFETPTFELKPFLEELGLELAFSKEADFSGIRSERDLLIGTALHKAKIIVNEEGTEAAAATVIGIERTSTSVSRPKPIMRIRVDKPFFYFIKDNKTGAVLFMGRMNQM